MQCNPAYVITIIMDLNNKFHDFPCECHEVVRE